MRRIAKERLSFETLEKKQLLAGDVLVNIVHGQMFIEGDAQANQIAIVSGETEGSYLIRGLDGTTVHLKGSAEAAPETGLAVTGVTGNVWIAMGAGDDVLNIHDASFLRGLSISMGEGKDVVRIGVAADPAPAALAAAAAASLPDHNVNVRGSLLIRTGADDDRVRIADAGVGGLLGVSTDGGSDTVLIGAEAVDPAAALAAASVNGSENDVLAEAAAVHARHGIDVLLGDGADKAVIRSARAGGQIGVGGGAGEDDIVLDDVKAHVLGVRGGDGDAADHVKLDRVVARHAAVGVGGGADKVEIADSVFGGLAVEMGAGNDLLSIASSKAARVLLLGGAGDGDELRKADDNAFDALVVAGFEIPEGSNQGTLPTRPKFALRPRGHMQGRQ
jgi:hypothetical protein